MNTAVQPRSQAIEPTASRPFPNHSADQIKPAAAANDGAPRAKRPGPALYETDSDRYVGPQRWQTQWWARLARRAWRYRAYTRWVNEACTELAIGGADYLKQVDGPCIFIANHQSHLDTLVTYEALPESIRRRLFFGAAQDRWFLKGQKKTVLKPWYQSLVLGNFPIMRGGGSKALSYAAELLEKGEHIFLFPEGTRATGESLGEFRHGVALLAKQLGVPVMPIYLSGLKELRPKGARAVVPGPAAIEFLAPQQFAEETSVADATASLQQAMNEAHRRYAKARTADEVEDADAQAPELAKAA